MPLETIRRHRREARILAGLDIGTSEIKVVVAEDGEDGIKVLGVGQARTRGARDGKVVNVAQIAECIHKAVETAEMMSGIEMGRVHVSITGGVRRSVNGKGMAAVRREVVVPRELREVKRTATAMALSGDEEVLAVVPQGFAVDGTTGVFQPLGMAAACLSGRYHVVTGSSQAVRNLHRVCERTDLAVDGIHLEALASGRAALDDDERELGVLLLDLGAATTSLAVHRDGVLLHTGLVPMGGDDITCDLAQQLRIPLGVAERIKLEHGCAWAPLLGEEQFFEIPSPGGREPKRYPREATVELIQPRVEDILYAVRRHVQDAGIRCEDLASGVVITGGTAELDGLAEVAEDVLGVPVRTGAPRGIGGLTNVVRRAAFSGAVGLVLLASAEGPGDGFKGAERDSGVLTRLWRWFQEATRDYV